MRFTGEQAFSINNAKDYQKTLLDKAQIEEALISTPQDLAKPSTACAGALRAGPLRSIIWSSC
jgi:sulfite reductase beta subunit-like hemoprotein